MVEGLRPPDVGVQRPDNSQAISGGSGDLMLQDGERMVTRGAVTRENGDFDLTKEDCVGDDIVIDLPEIGGSSIINLDLVSLGDPNDGDYSDDPADAPTDASRDFNVVIETLSADGEILTSRTPDAADSVEQVRAGFGVFSDNEQIRIEHAGLSVGENQINGTINVQSGSTDAVQIRGVDGTLQDADNSDALESIGDGLSDLGDAIADGRTEFEKEAEIDEEGEIIKLDTRSQSIVTLTLDADAEASYEVQTSPDDGGEDLWFAFPETFGDDLDDTDRIRETFRTGGRFIRVVVTDPAPEDETAKVALQASG